MIALDFFCGGGGMTCGLIEAGINVLCGIDSSPACKETYENNNKNIYLQKNICDLTPEELINLFPDIKNNDNLLLVGCAPCQPFSILRQEKCDKDGKVIQHKSFNLLNEFGRFVKALLPAHIFIENVPGLKGKGAEVLNEFKKTLSNNNYFFDEKVVYAKDYGVPQNRRRYILIASRKFKPLIPAATHGKDKLPYVTVRETISSYPSIKAGENCLGIPNHRCANLSPLLLKRIRITPHDGGSRTSWPKKLVLNCHKNFKGHTDVYGRMSWDKPSPTLTAKCYSISNGRFGHPDQDRAISLREAAALQTFPDSYIFEGSMQEIGKEIGNAVPVRLAKIMSTYILQESNKAQ
jgi:DNA (cytosine-5)-methyltransferase 1